MSSEIKYSLKPLVESSDLAPPGTLIEIAYVKYHY
jgi:hypothetical protein